MDTPSGSEEGSPTPSEGPMDTQSEGNPTPSGDLMGIPCGSNEGNPTPSKDRMDTHSESREDSPRPSEDPMDTPSGSKERSPPLSSDQTGAVSNESQTVPQHEADMMQISDCEDDMVDRRFGEGQLRLLYDAGIDGPLSNDDRSGSRSDLKRKAQQWEATNTKRYRLA